MSERDQILQACFDEIDREGLTVAECLSRHEGDIEWLGPLLTTAERLRKATAVKPSEAFQTAARARMLNMIAASGIVQTKPVARSQRRLYGMLLRVSVACLVLMVAMTATSFVAMAAYPESPLYPIKLALEDTRVLLAGSDQERLELRLEMAERRTAELVSMLHRGASSTDVERVAGLLESNVREVVRLAANTANESVLRDLQPRLKNQETILKDAVISSSANKEIEDGLERAIGVLERERDELQTRLGDDKVQTPIPLPEDDVQQKDRGWGEPAAPARGNPLATPAAGWKKDAQIVHGTPTPRSEGNDEDKKTPISDQRPQEWDHAPGTAPSSSHPTWGSVSTPGADSSADPTPSGTNRGRGDVPVNGGNPDPGATPGSRTHQPSGAPRAGESNRAEKATPAPTALVLTPTIQPSYTPTPPAESKATVEPPTPTPAPSIGPSRGSNSSENRGQGEPSSSSQTSGGGSHGGEGTSSSSGRR